MIPTFIQDLIPTFVHEWLFVVGLVLGFGLCGTGILAPFLQSRYALLSAPLAGLLLVPFGANAIYSILGVRYIEAALIAAASGLLLSAMTIFVLRPQLWRQFLLLCLFVLIAGAAAVLGFDAATLAQHQPSIFYFDGTDHGGYAQLADWINGHLADQPPLNSPEKPYQSWPEELFSSDPRFGTYGLLAIISALHQTSGIFAYDVACAIVMVSASLGIAGFYSRNFGTLIFVVVGLFVSNWFDYGHTGFLGKLISYPATFLVIGAALSSIRSPSLERAACLAILASAAGIMHSGTATAVLSAPILGVVLIRHALQTPRAKGARLLEPALICAIPVIVPVISSGILGRILAPSYPNWRLTWAYELPRILDLENQGVSLSGFGPKGILIHVAIAAFFWLLLIALSLRSRAIAPTGVLLGPAILLLLSIAFGQRAAAFQMIGYFYPAILCGTALLATDLTGLWPRMAVFFLLLVSIVERIPRFVGSVERYALRQEQSYIYTEGESASLAAEVRGVPTLINVAEPVPSIFLMIELGRRNLDLQWSERAWKAILSYRTNWTWPQPQPTKATINLSKERGPGHQFNVVATGDR